MLHLVGHYYAIICGIVNMFRYCTQIHVFRGAAAGGTGGIPPPPL